MHLLGMTTACAAYFLSLTIERRHSHLPKGEEDDVAQESSDVSFRDGNAGDDASDGRPATASIPFHMLHTLSPGGDASRVPS